MFLLRQNGCAFSRTATEFWHDPHANGCRCCQAKSQQINGSMQWTIWSYWLWHTMLYLSTQCAWSCEQHTTAVQYIWELKSIKKLKKKTKERLDWSDLCDIWFMYNSHLKLLHWQTRYFICCLSVIASIQRGLYIPLCLHGMKETRSCMSTWMFLIISWVQWIYLLSSSKNEIVFFHVCTVKSCANN